MVIMPANEDSEKGALPSEELLTEMGRYNEQLSNAGVLLAGEGLHPTSQGARVRFDGKHTVIPGPFAVSKDLIAGFWLWKVDSLDEAIAWAKRIPVPPDAGIEIAIRQVYEADEMGDGFTPELRAAEDARR
jgi:hypothetical protein